MSLPRLFILVAGLLTGVTFTVDSYVETRQPLAAAPCMAEECPGELLELPQVKRLDREAT